MRGYLKGGHHGEKQVHQIPQQQFHDGKSIQQLGFGVWNVPPKITTKVVGQAISTGFRSIDTAEAYNNEAEVGAALRRSGLPRDAFFITTKLWNTNQGRDLTLRAFDESMDRLGIETLDLYLMHWPSRVRDLYVETWRAFDEIQRQGRVRSIGVSNFSMKQLEHLMSETGLVPVVNQVELHPGFQQQELRAFHERYAIVTQSWSPLGMWSNGQPPLESPIIVSIAAKHRRPPAQIVLRWHLQEGLVPLTRSTQIAHIEENFGLFNFVLDETDMHQIRSMDSLHGRLGPDPETAEF